MASKTISKTSDKIIKDAAKELEEASEVYVDKKINHRIEREISHLGKERLIVDHVYNLAKKFNKKNKNKILFLLIKLYNFNRQIHESVAKELKNDKRLLNKRVKTKIEKSKVHKDLYKKLLKIANSHYYIVKKYADSFNPKIKYSKKFIAYIVYHKRKAEAIYKALTNIKMRKTLHRVLLKKLDMVYRALVGFTVQLAHKISEIVKDIKNGRIGSLGKKTKEIHNIVSGKIDVLRSFAYKYTYNVIHSEHFYDFDNNKLMLITKNM